LSPRRIGSVTKNPALRLVCRTDDRGQSTRWKERIALGEAHAVGMEIAPVKMFAADVIVIFFDGRVFVGLQHCDDLGLCGQLEQVVVVPGIRAERLPVALEQFHLAVNREHLLDKGSAEMEQTQ